MELYYHFTCYITRMIDGAAKDYIRKALECSAKETSWEDLAEQEGFDYADFDSEQAFERVLNWELLKKYISYLTPRECEALMGQFVNGLTQEELAAKMGISQKRVSVLRSSALEKLEAAMRGKI